MASDGASPMPGQYVVVKPGTAMPHFTALPFPLSTPGAQDQSPWEPSPQPSMQSAFSPGSPLVLSAFPSPLMTTGDGGPGPNGAGAGKVIVKVKTEVGPAEHPQTQNFVLTQTAFNWIASGTPCGGPEGPAPQLVTTSNVTTILPAKSVGVSQEGSSGHPPQLALPPAAQLTSIVSPEKAWPGPHGAPGEGSPTAAQSGPALGDLSYTSKGVYENFRRWQRYKALARRHLSQSPDAEALSCFLIPVLRSLARLKPTMTLEEGLPRAVQEWERTSNFDRMIFYEMAEKFMEFEAEEEMQIQNAQMLNEAQCPPPAAPLKLDPPNPPAPEVCQQPAYIPKKATSKSRAPRRRQRKSQKPPVPEAPKEIPLEAVNEYVNIMEGLLGSHTAIGESNGKQEEEEEPQQEDLYPDPGLLGYIDDLCSQEVFVCQVEAVIHPHFLSDLLSPEQHRDPLALIEELEQEEGLTLAQLVQKRLMALEKEDAEVPASCSGAQSDSSPSISDEDEDRGGRLRPSPGSQVPRGTVSPKKVASSGKQEKEGHAGQEQVIDGPREVGRDGDTLLSPSNWDLKPDLGSQSIQGPLNTERRGSETVTNQVAPCQHSHLEGIVSPGHSMVVDKTPEDLPLCWQEYPQLEGAPCVDVGLAETAPLQTQELERQVLGLQTEQEIGDLGVLPQGKEPLALSQEDTAGAMWGDDRGPLMVQSYDQDLCPGTAGDRDRDSLSPGLWLSSEMDAIGLELPLQIEEVTDNFQDGECVTEHQEAYETPGTGNLSLCLGEITPPDEVRSAIISSGENDAVDAPEKENYCSLPVTPRASSPDLTKENRKHNPVTTEDPSDLWGEDCYLLLESRIDAPILGSSEETLLPTCESDILILGIQDAASPEANQVAVSRGSPLLETAEHISILDDGEGHSLQQEEVVEGNCPTNSNSSDLQEESRCDTDLSRCDTDLSKPKDLAPLAETPKSASPHQDLGSTSPGWGIRNASVLRESSPVSAKYSAADRANKEEEEEDEDEELSNFAHLLASKLSLSPRRLSLSHHPTLDLPSVSQGSRSTLHSLSIEAGPPHTVAKTGKRALIGDRAPAKKKSHSGSGGGENPLALVDRPSQPRKRRRDSFVTGRRKKRRRSQ